MFSYGVMLILAILQYAKCYWPDLAIEPMVKLAMNPSRPAEKTSRNQVLSGIAVSPGLGTGRAFLFQDIFEREIKGYSIEGHQADTELSRLEEAFLEVIAHLEQAAENVADLLDSAIADIFHAHKAILQDDHLVTEIKREIENELICSEQAVQRVFRRWERKFQASSNQSLRQRGDDLEDLGRRLLRSLAGLHAHSLEYLTGYEGNAFACSGNLKEDLLSITAVHPLREDAVRELLVRFVSQPPKIRGFPSDSNRDRSGQ